jgi:hypothetical protein
VTVFVDFDSRRRLNYLLGFFGRSAKRMPKIRDRTSNMPLSITVLNMLVG